MKPTPTEKRGERVINGIKFNRFISTGHNLYGLTANRMLYEIRTDHNGVQSLKLCDMQTHMDLLRFIS